jgi:N-methylhydantoinase A
MPKRYYVGVDIGGTFTDLVAVDRDDGSVIVHKTPSSPPTFVEGVLTGLDELPFEVSEIEALVHGSTIGTNALIERRGAPTALLTTAGFRDVLLVARSTRPDVYDLRWSPGKPLVQRRHILEARERMDASGQVLTPLEEDDVRHAARAVVARGLRSVAICFLNSFLNGDHERRAREILQEIAPDVHVSISAEVFPEIREFERTSTTAVNAYLAPLLSEYLERLQDGLATRGMDGNLLVVHSGGGVMTPRATRAIPARTCYSGPAGGVAGAAYVGTLAGARDVITMDMGGTSCDVALVRDGRLPVTPGLNVEHTIYVGFPSVDLTTIGAGGGSIAWIDAAGALKSGPHSAGANPGPACYQRGGEEPTTTDAHCVLGRFIEEGLLGGRLRLDREAAERAIRTRIADPLGWSVEDAAAAIVRLANGNMVNAIRLVSVQRGHDPRAFALVAFGGAGGLHAAEIALEMSIPRLVLPRFPGLASAFGMLHVDVRHDLIRPIFRREEDLDAGAVNDVIAELEREAREVLHAEGADAADVNLQRQFDMKYFSQSSYLTLDGPGGELAAADFEALVADFNRLHEQEFGYAMPRDKASAEFGHVRVVAQAQIPKPQLGELAGGDAEPAPVRTQHVYHSFSGQWLDTPVYMRESLAAGATLKGPALIAQFDATSLIPPGASATVDRYGNMIIDIDEVA